MQALKSVTIVVFVTHSVFRLFVPQNQLNVLPLCCLLAKYICFQITLFSFQGAASDLRFQKSDFNTQSLGY